MQVFIIIQFLGIIIVAIGVFRLTVRKRFIYRVLFVILAIAIFLIITFVGFFLFWMHMDRERAITASDFEGVQFLNALAIP